jgi:hypothetical protein
MTTAIIFLMAFSFGVLVGLAVGWRLLTQLTPHPEADQEVEDQIANGGSVPVFKSSFHTNGDSL